MPRYHLVLGSKTWSSWSFRPWLLMREFAIPFDETVIALRRPGTAAEIAAYSPSGKVPVLIDRNLVGGARPGSAGSDGHAHAGGLAIWDTMAIVEHLAEQHPALPIWPRDPTARAVARSVAAEMHSGFAPLRQNCPMDFNARGLAPADPAAIAPDVARIVALWADCRARFGTAAIAGEGIGGPFLFGAFSAADAIYAPVVSRFTSYDAGFERLPEAAVASAYIAAVRDLDGWKAWGGDAAAEVPG